MIPLFTTAAKYGWFPLKSGRQHELVVVFDSNVYLGLGQEKLALIVEREAEVGVIAMSSVWPCLELLSRCAGSDRQRRHRAWVALRKIAQHSGYATPDGVRLRIHEAGEFSLARGLFGIDVYDPLLEIGFVADLAAAAATKSLDELSQEHGGQLELVAQRVQLEEWNFSSGVVEGTTKVGPLQFASSGPTQTELQLVAAGLLQVLADQYKVTLTSEDSRHAIGALVQNFGLAICFMYRLMRDASSSSGVPGGANSTWDLKLAFHGYRGAAVSGIPVLLVSDDRRLHQAALDAGSALRVVTRTDYQSLVADPKMVKLRALALVD